MTSRDLASGSWVREWSIGPTRSADAEDSLVLQQIAAELGAPAGLEEELLTRRSALQVSAVFACLGILADVKATVPLHLYRRTSEGGRQRVGPKEHPLARLLRHPNGVQRGAFAFQRLAGLHYAADGNFVSEIEFDRDGTPIALWPLPPRQIEYQVVERRRFYRWHRPGGRPVILSGDRVLHCMGLSMDGKQGLSPLTIARNAIGMGRDVQRFGHAWFRQGGRLGAVLYQKAGLTAEQKDRDRASVRSWSSGGLSSAERVLALEEGNKIESISITPADAEFLQLIDANAIDIARFFRIPPHKLGLLDRATHTNIEHQNIEFMQMTLLPLLTAFEQAFGEALLLDDEEDELFFEHVPAAFLRADAKTEADVLAVEMGSGLMSINEARARRNLARVDHAAADALRLPLAQALVYASGEIVVPARQKEEVKK